MKNFIQWLEEKQPDLLNVLDIPEPEKATEENTKRSGIRGQYPDGYVRSQYPHKYFNPISATADIDLKNAGSK